MPLPDRFRTLQPAAEALLDRAELVLASTPRVLDKLRRGWQVVAPLGRAVAAIGVLAWIAGWWLGWRELMVMAGTCLLLLVTTALFVLGRSSLKVSVELNPSRVVAGDPSAGQVRMTNSSSRRATPAQVELPVGQGMAVFDVPSLAPGAVVEELFVIPTERRGVIAVGPATSVRRDPLGLFHREAPGSPALELIVHPRTVTLEPFGAGLLRDLEGLTTKDLSVSDLAFHALREYSPGDDRRHIHWRSSAKAGRLLVRQFLDTRRSTLCVVVDGRPDAYGDPAEFETALEVAGSVALRACRDEMPAMVVAGDHAAAGVVPHHLLDALSRAELGRNSASLATLVGRAVVRGADISFAVLLSGSQSSLQEFQRAALRLPIEVRAIAVQVVPGSPTAIRGVGRATIVQLSRLEDLPSLLQSEAVV